MSYTTLRVSPRGVVFFEDHAERLGPALRPAFEQFAATANEGVYSLRANGTSLHIERRPTSKLDTPFELRTVISPVLNHHGPFAKPAPPSPYDLVRAPGTVSLLTSADGSEIYESCVSTVIAWDGESLVLVPEDRPRVRSIAEAFVARTFKHRRAPILTAGDWGLVLINAVSMLEAEWQPTRKAFEPQTLSALNQALEVKAERASLERVRR